MLKKFFAPLFLPKVRNSALVLFSVAIFAPLAMNFMAFALTPISDALLTGNVEKFRFWLGSCIAVAIAIIIYAYNARNSFVMVESVTDYELSSEYMKKVVRMRNKDYDSFGTGRMIEITETGVNTWVSSLLAIVYSMSMSVFFSLFGLINVFLINKTLFAVAVTYLAVLSFAIWYYNGSVNVYRKESKKIGVEIVRVFVRLLQSKTETMMNGNENSELDKIRELYLKRIEAFKVVFKFVEKMFTSGRIFSYGLRFTSIGVIGYGILSGTAKLPELLTVISSVLIIESTLSYFIDNYKNIMKNHPHIEKLWETYEGVEYVSNYEEGKDFEFKKGDVDISELTFSYDGGEKVFENFDIRIEGGKKTALVGRSGAGKTTIVKLILGLSKPDSGTISIDGNDLSKTKLTSFFKHVSYLSQDPSIFDGTIRENLLAVKSDAIEDEMVDALNNAECDFVFKMKNRLETEIGERGVLLSGGQKQRLALAKVFLKNPEFVILDEPTSALDSFSEEKITKAIHKLMVGRTMIIIAHRLQTVKDCDDIIVLGKNSVLERGTHEELVSKKGPYSEMLDLQSGTVKEN